MNKKSSNASKQGSNLEIISLDADNKGPIIIYKINDKVRIVEFDYSTESDMFDYFIDYDYQLGDLTGDGIDELVISMFFSNNFHEGLQDTFVYTLNGENLTQLLHVDTDDWFVNDCVIGGVSIEEGQLNIIGEFVVWLEKHSCEYNEYRYEEHKYVICEHRSLQYADGNWSEIYRDKFHISKADGPYDDCSFANESELYAEFYDKYKKEPEKMLSIYPEMYESVIK